jgi:hypothetical protein
MIRNNIIYDFRKEKFPDSRLDGQIDLNLLANFIFSRKRAAPLASRAFVAAALALPGLASLADQEPDDPKRGHGIHPPRIEQ